MSSNPASKASSGAKRKKPEQTDLEVATEKSPEEPSFRSCDEIVRSFVKLEPILGVKNSKLNDLSAREKSELEEVLEINEDNPWKEDWAGNLNFADQEILNPDLRGRKKQSFRQSLLLWAANNTTNRRLVHNLIRLVVNMKTIPAEAKRILCSADSSSLTDLEEAIRRTSYDPIVLKQDGWTTVKSEQPEGSSGGAHWIGEMIRWQNWDAVVLAFVYDPEIGDLWKVAWIEEGELTTFDLEAEEIQEGRKKWLRRQNGGGKGQQDSAPRKSQRYLSSEIFSVEGVEEGIVLAASLSKTARQGVYWPARIMHPSENGDVSLQGKRSSSKQKLDLVFLAPYWDSENLYARGRKVEALSETGSSAFHTGALFQVEASFAAFDTIQPYPFDPENDIDIEQVKNTFRFTGLPKPAFSRFLDSHRLALALKLYARKHAKKNDSPANMATAGLFETHPVAIRTPIFPSVVLHLPFSFILSQLPKSESYDDTISPVEPILHLAGIVDAMKPPTIWGSGNTNFPGTPDVSVSTHKNTGFTPSIKLLTTDKSEATSDDVILQGFLSGLRNMQQIITQSPMNVGLKALLQNITGFLHSIHVENGVRKGEESKSSSSLMKRWACIRSLGEETVCVINAEKSKVLLQEWRIASERMYRHTIKTLGCRDGTLIVTDWRCNFHLTSGAAFERCVRLPAALKGARLAGLGSTDLLKLVKGVSDECIDYVESVLLARAHGSKYIEKIKERCASAQSRDDVIMLTEDSDGNGGEDTRGSKETWKAAVCGVAAAVTAVNSVMDGGFVNAFCATRPPGHHAGRTLHPMKAVSNGFCVLNPAACAAIHATTPTSEGGLGLSRVCVIDFDVHHGNGTQDILCSTFDPRFMYVSTHAGGKHVNGAAPDEDLNILIPGASKKGGIYPGRCGDTSPHPNVLNIPLGQRVTSHAVGTALVSRITPAVEAFSPNLIIVSAGFDAHVNDPMQLGTLSAQDFGHITEVACQLAFKSCSGRIVSILEGGYGIPCCRPQRILPPPTINQSNDDAQSNGSTEPKEALENGQNTCQPITNADPLQQDEQQYKLLDLGDELPDDMDDQVPQGMQRRLDKCHLEGFIQCVKEHVGSLAKCSARKY